jgi:hypothetical protein
MPRKSNLAGALPPSAAEPIPATVVEELVTGPMSLWVVHSIGQAFKKTLIERAMGRSSPMVWGIRRATPVPRARRITAMGPGGGPS